MASTVELRTWDGEPAVTLHADEYSATFLPSCGMLCASLRYRDEEHVAWPHPVAAVRTGATTAIPLLHPWGNRLDGWEYRAGRKRVDLRGLDLSVDEHGLPIHGNLRGAAFDLVHVAPGRIRARFDYGADPEKLVAFPFPHTVAVDARLDARGLRLATEVVPTGRAAVPISFCWHPYFRLPAGPRREWVLRRPACEHVEVDERVMPTGARTPEPAEQAPIGRRTFDDHYALGRDRRFALGAEGRTLEVRFDANYPYAQIYAPPRREFVAIEPMTATIDALGTGRTPMCAPGTSFRATFTIACGE
jgi:galactose mutarotase-like enzyme